MAISSRLRNLIDWRGLKQRKFAAETGIPYPALRKHLDARSAPGADHLIRLMRAGIDIGWLLTGRNSGPLCDWLPDVETDFAAFGDQRFLAAIMRQVEDLFVFDYERRNETGEAQMSFGECRAAGRAAFERCLLTAKAFSDYLEQSATKGATPEMLAERVLLALDGTAPILAAGQEPERRAAAPMPAETGEVSPLAAKAAAPTSG